MSEFKGITNAHLDGGLLAISIVEAGLNRDMELLDRLLDQAAKSPEGVAGTMASTLCHLLEDVAGTAVGLAMVQTWRAKMLRLDVVDQ